MRKKLKEIRIKRNLTQEELASKIGITRAYYTNLEVGRGHPSFQVAEKIKKVLRYRKDDLFYLN